MLQKSIGVIDAGFIPSLPVFQEHFFHHNLLLG
jgi:hypothetical protein